MGPGNHFPGPIVQFGPAGDAGSIPPVTMVRTVPVGADLLWPGIYSGEGFVRPEFAPRLDRARDTRSCRWAVPMGTVAS